MGRFADMKYSLRSLMIVVTLAGVASGLFARSRYCAKQAAFHRSHLPSDSEILSHREMLTFFESKKLITPGWREELARDEERRHFHKDSARVYETVSRMPWLLLSLPQPPAGIDPTELYPPKPVDPKEELKKQEALDLLRTNLAKEAREKYGVP